MGKWYSRLLEQKQLWDGVSQPPTERRGTGTSTTEFTFLQGQPAPDNPYRQEDDEEEDAAHAAPFPAYSPHSEFPASRNGSSTSLRSRSTTGESGPPSAGISGRMPPPRLPAGSIPQVPLTVRTQQLPGYIPSPAEKFAAESYFSPTTMDSPMSSRTSSSSSLYPFPRQIAPSSLNSYYEEGHSRYTAPVMSRSASRENTASLNAYPANARGPPRPSFPAGAGMHSSQQVPTIRNRSASSPDINAQRRAMNAPRPPMPEGPIPSYPAQYMPGAVPRSQSNSPSLPNGAMPRMGTSPKVQRQQSYQHNTEPPQFGHDNGRPDSRFAQVRDSRTNTPTQQFQAYAMSPPLPSSSDSPQPTQLKVKVHATAAGQVLTLVVPLGISYQSLKDRIDAKLQRSTNISLSDRTGNQVKLKYLDEDDFVSIQSDEDVQNAFEAWKEQRGEGIGGMGEIELFCQ